MITRLSAALLAVTLLLTPPSSARAPGADDEPAAPAPVDALGDPLPAGAAARFGHGRLRLAEGVARLAFDAEARAVDSRSARGDPRRWSVDDGRALPAGPAADAEVPAALAAELAAGRLELRAAADGRAWFSLSLRDGSVGLHLPGDTSHALDLGDRSVTDAAFDPRASAVVAVGARITSRSDYGTFVVRIDLATLQPAWEVELAGMVPAQVRVLAGQGEGADRVAVSSRDGQVRLIDLHDGGREVRWTAHAAELSATEPGPGGSLLTGSVDGDLAVWDVPADGAPNERWRRDAHTGRVSALAGSSELGLIASGGHDRRVRLWSLDDGTAVAEHPRHESRLTRARQLDDGAVITAAWSGRLGLWDAAGNLQRLVEAHTGRITGLAAFADAGLLLTAGQDGRLALWTADGEPAGAPQDTSAAVIALAATPDGSHIASSGGDGLVRLWSLGHDHETDTARLRAEAALGAGSRAAFALAYLPDASGLVIASSLVRLVDAASAEDRWAVPVGAPVASAAVSPDGSRLALALASRTVLVLDTADGSEVWRWTGLPGRVAAVAFGPDGRRVAAAGGDASVRVAEVGSGVVRELSGHLEEVAHLSWTAAGLLSASADGTALLWRL